MMKESTQSRRNLSLRCALVAMTLAPMSGLYAATTAIPSINAVEAVDVMTEPSVILTLSDGTTQTSSLSELTTVTTGVVTIAASGPCTYDDLVKLQTKIANTVATLVTADFSGLQLSGNSSFSFDNLFKDCKLLQTVKLPAAGTDVTTTMRSTFSGCNALKTIENLEKLTHTTNFDATFYGCKALTLITLPIPSGTYETSFNSTFLSCAALDSVANIGKYSLISNASKTFSQIHSRAKLDLSQWTFTSNAVAEHCFQYSSVFFLHLPLQKSENASWKASLSEIDADETWFYLPEASLVGYGIEKSDTMKYQGHYVLTSYEIPTCVYFNGLLGSGMLVMEDVKTAKGSIFNGFVEPIGNFRIEDFTTLNTKVLQSPEVTFLNLTNLEGITAEAPALTPKNPNMLIKVSEEDEVPATWKNVQKGESCSTLDLVDGYSFQIFSAELSVQQLTYTRKALHDGHNETICLPFAPDSLPEGYVFSEMKEQKGDSLYFSKVDAMETGKAYLMRWTGEKGEPQDVTFTAKNAIIPDDPEDASFMGLSYAFPLMALQGPSVYTLGLYDGQEQFRKAANTATLQPFRAFFLQMPTGGSEVKHYTLVMDDALTTGIALNPKTSSSVSPIYDLQGRRVEKMQKGGLYIVNGKKTIYQ